MEGLPLPAHRPARASTFSPVKLRSLMDPRDPHYVSGSESDAEHSQRPHKRARRSPSSDRDRPNGKAASSPVLPPLSLSILGVEPLDEFIREIADFIHHLITTRSPDLQGEIEVEAKMGVIKDRGTGSRLQLPVLVETSVISVILCLRETDHSM
jgi:polynucleotide 5'-triphosphatase